MTTPTPWNIDYHWSRLVLRQFIPHDTLSTTDQGWFYDNSYPMKHWLQLIKVGFTTIPTPWNTDYNWSRLVLWQFLPHETLITTDQGWFYDNSYPMKHWLQLIKVGFTTIPTPWNTDYNWSRLVLWQFLPHETLITTDQGWFYDNSYPMKHWLQLIKVGFMTIPTPWNTDYNWSRLVLWQFLPNETLITTDQGWFYDNSYPMKHWLQLIKVSFTTIPTPWNTDYNWSRLVLRQFLPHETLITTDQGWFYDNSYPMKHWLQLIKVSFTTIPTPWNTDYNWSRLVLRQFLPHETLITTDQG